MGLLVLSLENRGRLGTRKTRKIYSLSALRTHRGASTASYGMNYLSLRIGPPPEC